MQYLNIDNMSKWQPVFPVVFTADKKDRYTTDVPKYHIFNMNLVQNNSANNINFIESFRLSLDPISVKLDFSFINTFS